MDASVIPPIPAGFKLMDNSSGPDMPPIPAGFKLVTASPASPESPSTPKESGFFDQLAKGTLVNRYKAGTILYPDEEKYLRAAVASAASGPASGIVQVIADLLGAKDVSNRISQTKKAGEGNVLGSLLQPELWLGGKAVAPFIGAGSNFATQALRSGAALAPYGAALPVSSTSDSPIQDRAMAGLETGAAGAVGSLFGSSISAGAKAIGKLGATERARVAMESIIGKGNIPQAQQLANQSIGKDVSSIQALAPLDNPTVSAMGTASRGSSPQSAQFYTDLASRQDAANLAPLEKLARGASSTKSMDARQVMKDKLEEALGPVRERVMQTANNSINPLDLSPIENNLDSMMNTPGLRASGKVQSVLGALKDKFDEAVKVGNGIPDARDIYEIRKSGINEIVDTLTAGQDPKTSSKLAAKLTGQVRPMIDDAFANAGGPEWKSYITQYHKGLQAVDRVELMDKARQLYLNSPKKFIDLIKGESPKTVQKIMSGSYDINDVLSSNKMNSLTDIMSNVARDTRIKELASTGQSALQSELASKGLSAHLPNFLWRPAMVANAALKTVEVNKNSAMWKILDEASKNPEKMSELLNGLPIEQQNMVLKFINKTGKVAPFAAAVATNN